MRYGSEPKLLSLNDGWPFGDGPMEWDFRVEVRDGQIHMVCVLCPQSIVPLAHGYFRRGFTWKLAGLKPRIADHVLKCHPEAVES